MRQDSLTKKWLRLTAFLLCAQCVFTLLGARYVSARVDDLAMSSGAQMMRMSERGTPTPRTVMLNGAEFRLRVQTARNARVEQVLDTFHQRCRERNGGFLEALDELAPTLKWTERQLALLDGVWRVDGEQGGGLVACMDTNGVGFSPESFADRAKNFGETGDFSAFGDLRFIRADQEGDDVFVVMVWTDGALPLAEMFPTEGDAPGIDFDGLPRPPESRRIFSSWERGQAPATNIYIAEHMSGEEVDGHYRDVLSRQGWEALNEPSDDNAHVRGLMVMRQGVSAIISTRTDDAGRGVVSVTPMDVRGAARITRSP